ncbi:MAG: metal-dependent transcriptional regulator [Gemmatimonadota bacterium]|nr:metal-dependent transcriptional regulator [Gemmatimonadota bacterium]MDH3366611.1 metal-dependent transcriptional regulator [Gemmatimonadota bacterium]MDH3476863.1 metal-dependent transcriptional regulator [Gemmatimonadota bacterium]MDH3569481.1 metal-dependent transcriptional regulator [Gemmatimonadota bacterium]MDH5548487.1 metal-dependent transcriptional regulator [Gemmatimonadota bacterium]
MSALSRQRGLSRSTEDYLKTIYELETRDGAAQTSAIADALAVAPPSVSGMVKRLSDSGLLAHVPYRGVQLTQVGRRTAMRVLRRHRILEKYLTAKLGYDWDSVHEEAERLEHAVSDELIERMAMALGNPEFDPHGAPIPTKDGTVAVPEVTSLSEVPVGETAELRLVSDKDSELLRYLRSLGLRLGVVFEVVSRQPFRGPITIRFAAPPQDEEVVGYELAQSLGCVIRGDEVG